MFARVFTIQARPGKLDEAADIFRNDVIPAVKQQKGFHNALLLTDPETGKALSITLWDTEADQKASEGNGSLQQQLGKVGALLAGPPLPAGFVVSVQA